jgi:acylphosphatase
MKLRIRIVGPKVHDVGYRYLLLGSAMSLSLSGFDANNLAEGNNQFVDVVVEGKGDQIKAYRTFVETRKPPNAEVSDIAVSDYDGDVMKIAEYAQVLTAMQMLKAIPTMMKIEQNTNIILENTKPTPQILEEIKGLREDIQPGFASRFQQVQADVKAIKARLGMS